MKVIRGLSTNPAQPATSPFPEKNGLFIELRGGDFCHPRGNGNWFKPPYFAKITRFWLPYQTAKALALFLCTVALVSAVQLYQHGLAVWPFIFLLPAPLFNPGVFISWRFGRHGGYIGAKCYGVDSPAYKHWLPASEVYEGSQAIMFSIRPHANLE